MIRFDDKTLECMFVQESFLKKDNHLVVKKIEEPRSLGLCFFASIRRSTSIATLHSRSHPCVPNYLKDLSDHLNTGVKSK